MKKRKTNKKTCNMYAMNRLMPNKNISTVKHLCLIVSFTIFGGAERQVVQEGSKVVTEQ